MAASPHHVETDELLVLAAQDGDPDAFGELFRRHYPMVRRVCARKLRDLREADEIAQAAFVRAYERLDKCTGERRFGAWVQVIANNLCIDHMRAVARTTPVDEPVGEHEPIGFTPEDHLLNSEQAAMIKRALATLPDRQRDVVVARDVDGRRPPEIAAALGLSLGAVDSLLLRARRRLAASVQSMSAESGAASFMTTAAVASAGSTIANIGPMARVAGAVSEAVASASYQVAAALGMVPGAPSAIGQLAPAAAAGLISLTPFGHAIPHTPLVPAVDPIVVTIPDAPIPPTIVGETIEGVRGVVIDTNELVEPLTNGVEGPKVDVPAPAKTGLLHNVGTAADNTVGGVGRLIDQISGRSAAR